jgi:YD repeat-containing protein
LSITSKPQPSHKTTFRYDGLGRRVAIDTANGALTTEIRYLWCDDALCQARTSADVVSRRYYSEGEYLTLGGELAPDARDYALAWITPRFCGQKLRVSYWNSDGGPLSGVSGLISPAAWHLVVCPICWNCLARPLAETNLACAATGFAFLLYRGRLQGATPGRSPESPPLELPVLADQDSVSFLPTIEVTGLLTLAPAGLTPADYTGLSWTYG